MNQYQSTNQLVDLYSHTSQIASRGSFLKKYSIRDKSLHDYVIASICTQPLKSLVDIGTGNGSLIRKLAAAHPSASYAAIDIAENKDMVDVKNVTYKLYDGDTLPELRPPYQWILFMHMLYHVSNIEEFVAKVVDKYGNTKSKILITTKSKYTMPAMEKIVLEALDAGNPKITLSLERDESHFCSENAPDILTSIFSNKKITSTLIETAFEVNDLGDLKAYILSTPRYANALKKLASVSPDTLDEVIARHLPFSDTYTESIHVIS